ncbi:hypothetical protein SAMN06265365_1103 [Tistlia consotensis]|uniref:Uncharacterized protein n=1 Tax=Tistlia consotensis USBA 355 TaxID=560819 RepID=A0A1Y6BTU6_9PROT|nr:hypothetical protein [Tistlia consotensis]SMF28154.1 hypothetical protein SAMN05428998_109153 [Tistlia consotensis USBA 355]SNR65098.1 hypothetical protein SAMN06265365_1103 [Tistlia consotensis]
MPQSRGSRPGDVHLLPVRTLECLPVIAFGLCTHVGATDALRFLVSGGIAAVVLVLLLRRRSPQNPLLLGGNLQMVIVGASFALYLGFGIVVPGLAGALLTLRETAWLLMVLLVSTAYTLASPGGCLACEADRCEPRSVRRGSLLLLAATCAGVLLSSEFRGQEMISAVLPLTALYLLQRWLAARAERRRAGTGGTAGAIVALLAADHDPRS